MNLRRLLPIVAILVAICAPPARAETVHPLHNPLLGLDVDGNHLITPRDALLVINVLLQPQGQPSSVGTVSSLAQAGPSPYYYDTSDDGLVTPRDALLVINHLVVPTPEPSSIVLGALGFASLALFGWRRQRAKK